MSELVSELKTQNVSLKNEINELNSTQQKDFLEKKRNERKFK